MLAVHLENGRVEVRRAPMPRRREGYASIRVLAAGICNTDLELQRGYYGFRGRPGHEFAGEVVEADDASLIGRRVAGEINLACGRCDWCARGLGRHCPKRTVLGIVRHPGAFAGFLTLPERNLHVLPPRLPIEHAVFVEPVAAACEILDQVKIPRGAEAAVLGDGKLGLLIAQVLAAHGAKVRQFGRHREKLRIAERAGVETEIARGKLPRAAFDHVVDATGSPEGLRAAVAMTRPRGTVVMKSTVHGTVGIDAAPVIVNEITLVGSRCGRFERAIPLLASGKVRVEEMISERMTLADAPKAFARAAKRGVLKVLFVAACVIACLAQTPHPPVTGVALPLDTSHPRLIFHPGRGRTVESVRALYKSDPTFQPIFARALALDIQSQHPAMLAACWVVTGGDRYAEAAIDAMLAQQLRRSSEPQYSLMWSHALAYDWLYHHPAMTADRRERIVAKLIERLETELADLDRTSMALWHGRNQAANGAIVVALAIGDLPGQDRNLRRAAAHYIESLRALQYSEGWPEGASYWIYNRAGPYAVAADAVMTALGVEVIGGIPIRDVMRRIGLWSLYQFAPNEVFEPYGDSAGSLRLGETGWWELSVDYYARLSRDPGVAAAADYLRNRSPIPYGRRPYGWYAALSYDPSVRPNRGYDPARPELWMRKHLPQSMLFGRDSMGVAFFRGDWGDRDELYATFKAGDLLAHHDHYDSGHFGIQRGGLLAPQTGLYGPGGYTGPHRLGYSVQTVASNSLLILAPGETSAQLRRIRSPWTSISGGQRVILPTSFDCLNVAHFERLRTSGPRLERAAITAFESAAGRYDYIAADITASYNSTAWADVGSAAKVSRVTRQFLYLRPEAAFVVYDRVETTRAEYLPKFLLHSLSKPRTESETLVAGNGPEDGILESSSRRVTTSHARGVLTQIALLPAKARVLKIGGPNYNCYVEGDGDQSNGFNGVNLSGGDPLKESAAAQLGLWRTEVEPLGAGTSTRFLNVLLPRLAGDRRALPAVELLDAGPEVHAVRVGGTVAVFAHGDRLPRAMRLSARGARRLLLFDAEAGAAYRAGGRQVKASAEGVVYAAGIPPGAFTIER